MAKTTRTDQLLVDLGLASSVKLARALILAGDVFLGERRIDTAGARVSADGVLRLAERSRYVGRGGEKLAGALEGFDLKVDGLVGLDVGASTGGFTDCLLQHGASRVYAVDVGRGQLAERLITDDRVVAMSRTNARYAFALPEPVDVLVTDLSFISLRLVLPSSVAHLRPGGLVLALVKPQFESPKDRVGRGGVVREPAVHAEAVGDFCVWALGAPLSMRLLGVRRSVLEGSRGNREFFVLLRKDA
jgi:23S rRNA (cytidine1920-2'-O)/16S rRNA (cytidine1409-2'-O)-methyltransferase